MSESNKKINSNRKQSLLRLALVVGILVMLNIVAQFAYGYFDLTDDKRYSLTNCDRRTWSKNLDEKVFVTVYLEGDFPAGFRRLQSGVQRYVEESLDHFQAQVDYQFIDPYAGNVEDVNKQVEQLG